MKSIISILAVTIFTPFFVAQQSLKTDSLISDSTNLRKNVQSIRQQLAFFGNQKTGNSGKKFRFSLGRENTGIYRDTFTNRLYYQNGFGRTKVTQNDN